MKSKNGATKLLFVFIIFLGASFTAAQSTDVTALDSSMSTAATGAEITEAATATTEAGTDSVTSATAAPVVTVDTVTQNTGESSSSVGGTETTQESVVTAVTSNPVDGQSTQEQTTEGAGLSASSAAQEQTAAGAELSVSTASQEQTTAGAGLSASAATHEQTTERAGLGESSAPEQQTTAEETTGTGKAAGAAPDGTTKSAGLEVTTTEAELTSVEVRRPEAERRGDDSVNEERSTGQTTEEPETTSTKSSESTETAEASTDGSSESTADAKTDEKTRRPAQPRPKETEKLIVICTTILIALAVLTGIAFKICSNGSSSSSPSKERIMLESGGPGEPAGASNPIPDAQMVGDEGPVPGAPATPNGGGQPISNPNDEGSWVVPIDNMENTKL